MIFSINTVIDLRNFTKWSSNKDADALFEAPKFLNEFWNVVSSVFNGCILKSIGDGALIIKSLENPFDKDKNIKALTETIECINEINKVLIPIIDDFGKLIGSYSDMQLGCGSTKGRTVKLENEDYFGPCLNKAFRLCDQARPCGIILDYYDYFIIKDVLNDFTTEDRQLKGFEKPVKIFLNQNVCGKDI